MKRLVIIPYIRGFPEELMRNFGGYDIPTYFKPTNTLRQLLVHPKDPVGKTKLWAQCTRSAVRNVKLHILGKPNVHWRPDLESIGDRIPPHQRSRSTYTPTAPSHTSRLENMKNWLWSTNGSKEEWRRQYTSGPLNLFTQQRQRTIQPTTDRE